MCLKSANYISNTIHCVRNEFMDEANGELQHLDMHAILVVEAEAIGMCTMFCMSGIWIAGFIFFSAMI